MGRGRALVVVMLELLWMAAALCCSHDVRARALRAREAAAPCAPCDRLLSLCDEAPRSWQTVHEIREALREIPFYFLYIPQTNKTMHNRMRSARAHT